MKKKVCMFVRNNCKNDARVLKEAGTLTQNGYEVQIIAVFDRFCIKDDIREEKNGITIQRLELKSLVIILLTLFRNLTLFVPQMLKIQNLFRQLVLEKNEKKKQIQIDKPRKVSVLFWGIIYLLVRFFFSAVRKSLRFILVTSKKVKGVLYGILKKILIPFHRPFISLDYYLKASKAAIEFQPDIIHCHDLNTLWAGYLVKRKRKHVKFIYDSHELYLYRNKSEKQYFSSLIEKITERYLINKVDSVITVSQSIADFLQEKYKIKSPSVIMNCPITHRQNDEENSITGVGYEIFDNKDVKKVLYLGGRTFNRGIEYVIEAIKYTEKDVVFILMGPGNKKYDEKFMKIAEENNVLDRVFFLDPVPHDQVILYAKKADVGISPIINSCLSYYFCLPNKLFEYVNSALPVLSSNFPEMKRIVEGYQIGETFDPTNPKDIADKINSTLEKERHTKYIHNCLDIAGQFTWETEEKKLSVIYQSL
ncbi:glycosyltransferase [Brevibacillus panacihumi]|uniref:glycosyltransferase n=1 Tax=Brevibacillus panacihumi TaxID=497735 RepID=UPI003D080AF2